MDCSGKKKRARNLMPVYSEDKDNNENAKNSQKKIFRKFKARIPLLISKK